MLGRFVLDRSGFGWSGWVELGIFGWVYLNGKSGWDVGSSRLCRIRKVQSSRLDTLRYGLVG